MKQHTLIIGGTGMLTEASVALAREAQIFTSVARSLESLRSLDRLIRAVPCEHHMVSLNWSEPEVFCEGLGDHAARIGAPTLAVAWLHDDSLGPGVARSLAQTDGTLDFFQIRGSSAGSPRVGADAVTREFSRLSRVQYHQIILGFKLTQTGSRWLHNSEISSGVLAAIADRKPLSVVGVVEPWERRP